MKTGKVIIKIMLFVSLIIGLLMMTCDPSETVTDMEVILVNGGGVLMFGISLLLLSALSENDDEPEQKGGKYYGIR